MLSCEFLIARIFRSFFSQKIILLKTMVPLNGNYTNKTVVEKCKAIKYLEKGMSKRRVVFFKDILHMYQTHLCKIG